MLSGGVLLEYGACRVCCRVIAGQQTPFTETYKFLPDTG